MPFLPVETSNQNAAGSQETVANAPNTIVKQPLDPADLSQAHLSGAQTEETTVRKGQKKRHKRQSGYRHVFEEDAKHKKGSDNVVAVQGVVSNRNLFLVLV